MNVTIDRCHGEIRLPLDELAERTRFQQLLRAALGEPLALELERRGVRPDEIICIREINAVVRTRIADHDRAIIAQIVEAIANAVLGSGDGSTPSDNVIRFPSLRHACIAAVRGIVGGELEQSWAWRQALSQVTPTVNSVLRALLQREPHALVPVLCALAADPSLFGRVLQDVTPREWQLLTTSALRAAGAPADVTVAVSDSGTAAGGAAQRVQLPLEMGVPATDPHALVMRRVQHALVRSRLAAAVMNDPHACAASASIAALALLETEPVLMRSTAAETAWRMTQQLLARTMSSDSPDRQSPSAELAMPAAPRAGSRAPERRDLAARSQAHVVAAAAREASAPLELSTQAPVEAVSSVLPGSGALQAPAVDARAPDRTASLNDERPVGHTELGGLLYLLHIVGDLELADAIVRSELWADRSLTWVFHRIALGLVAARSNDPAVLAFCGLTPCAEPPDVAAAPASEAEQIALVALCARIVNALVESTSTGDEDAADVLQRTVARSAVITADPGWLEVRFDLEAIDIAVRRAGLDRNPDYVPWLGMVVRFVYE